MESIDENHSKDDRISNLGDPLLGLILSRLPTKNAAATTILSKRWKPLFLSSVRQLNQINLNDKHMLHPPKEGTESGLPSFNYANFVDKLFNETFGDISSMDNISISCEKDYGSTKISSWVSAAVRLNVRKLKLTFGSQLDDPEVVFYGINGCASLVELDVRSKFDLYVPEYFVLPNLKRLILKGRSPPECVSKLLDGCPMLEELSINECNLLGVDTLSIKSGSLKKLFIMSSWNEGRCKIIIDAPNLEYFLYRGFEIADYTFKDFMSLHAVSIELAPTFGSSKRSRGRVHRLVEACSSAVRLCLDGNAIVALGSTVGFLPFPKFQNLTCLALGEMGKNGWEMLAHFLLNSPNLESLRIEAGFGKYKRNYAAFESLLPALPSCLKLSFKKFEIWKMTEKEDEYKLIEYFLKNGSVLQEVIVHCCFYQITRFSPRLSSFPRLATACQVCVIEREKRVNLPRRFTRWQWFELDTLLELWWVRW